MAYVDAIDALSIGDTSYLSHPLTLKERAPEAKGIVAYRFTAESYKNNGSIVKITPYYYLSISKPSAGIHTTFNFAEKRDEILAMVERIKSE